MGHRLKNSDFRPFLDVLEGKMRDSGAYVGEGKGIYLGMFSSGESMPRDGIVGEIERNYLLTD